MFWLIQSANTLDDFRFRQCVDSVAIARENPVAIGELEGNDRPFRDVNEHSGKDTKVETCSVCGQKFFTAGEQELFGARGYSTPGCCKLCRSVRKQ